jgi:hypothetical protein
MQIGGRSVLGYGVVIIVMLEDLFSTRRRPLEDLLKRK